MNLKIYKPEITCKGDSMLSGSTVEEIAHSEPRLEKIPILREFMADDDLQEITVCSTNFGFVKTFTKHYRK